MHVLRHPNEVLAFVESYPDPCVTALIQQRMEELTDEDTSMEELVVFVILEIDDGIEILIWWYQPLRQLLHFPHQCQFDFLE